MERCRGRIQARPRLEPKRRRGAPRICGMAAVPGAHARRRWPGLCVPVSLTRKGRAGTEIAWILFNARRYDEATHELRSVLAVRPDDATALWFLGFALIANGQPEEAIHVLEKTVSIMDRSPGAIGVLVRAYADAGRRTDALRLLAELKRRKQAGYVPAAAFVNAYLGLGDYEQAFAWLERAYQEQSSILLWLKVHPFFDPLRGDPRFADLLHRVGLDHTQ